MDFPKDTTPKEFLAMKRRDLLDVSDQSRPGEGLYLHFSTYYLPDGCRFISSEKCSRK